MLQFAFQELEGACDSAYLHQLMWFKHVCYCYYNYYYCYTKFTLAEIIVKRGNYVFSLCWLESCVAPVEGPLRNIAVGQTARSWVELAFCRALENFLLSSLVHLHLAQLWAVSRLLYLCSIFSFRPCTWLAAYFVFIIICLHIRIQSYFLWHIFCLLVKYLLELW